MPAAPEADPRINEFIILQAQNAGLFLGQIPNPLTGERQTKRKRSCASARAPTSAPPAPSSTR